MDMRAGGDVFDGVDEAFETQRYDRFAALVFLNGARCTNNRVQSAALCDLGLNTCLLQLAGADLDRRVVVLLALIDGQIVHSHRIFLRGRRGVGKAHGIAVKADFASIPALRGHGFGRFLLETHVFAAADCEIVLARRSLLRSQRIIRQTVRIAIINDGPGRLGLSGTLFCGSGQNAVEPSGKRAVRASDDQADHPCSHDRGHNQESACRPSHSEPPARRSISAYFVCSSTLSFSRSSWTVRSLRSASNTKNRSVEPAWKPFRALSTEERAGGSWRDVYICTTFRRASTPNQ